MEYYGTYKRSIRRDPDNGSLWFELASDDGDLPTGDSAICVAGEIPALPHGIRVIVDGEWKAGQKGKQVFAVSTLSPDLDSRYAAETLVSSICPELGKEDIRKIIEKLGDMSPYEYPWKMANELFLTKVCELSVSLARATINNIRASKDIQKLYKKLARYGISFQEAATLQGRFGDSAADQFMRHPYSAVAKCAFPFQDCDYAAFELGRPAYSSDRVKALICHSVRRITSSGSTACTLEKFWQKCKREMSVSAYTEPLPATLIVPWITSSPRVTVTDDGYIHPERMYAWEVSIKTDIDRIQGSSAELPFDEKIIGKVEDETGVIFYGAQRDSIRMLKTTGIKILTGGPGTGKTTVIKGIIAAFRAMKPRGKVSLCAPTGRAAQKMSSATGMPAETVHKLLNYKPYSKGEPLCDPIRSDLVIVDEMSMMDTELFCLLLKSLKNGVTLILSGDIDQLPSVGAGSVLGDIIDSGLFETCRLNVIKRQAEKSSIVANAVNFNRGYSKVIKNAETEVYYTSSTEENLKTILEIAAREYNPEDPFSFQILSPTKAGLSGVKKCNEEIEKLMNPEGQPIRSYGTSFKVGDKVIMTKNNYDAGYFNGDLGTITAYDDTTVFVDINGDGQGKTLSLSYRDLSDMELAYAMTVHKSQGSEFPVTCIVLQEDPKNMLQRKLLFTAATRAKTREIFVVEGNALKTAVKKDTMSKRDTYLPRLIKKQS